MKPAPFLLFGPAFGGEIHRLPLDKRRGLISRWRQPPRFFALTLAGFVIKAIRASLGHVPRTNLMRFIDINGNFMTRVIEGDLHVSGKGLVQGSVPRPSG